MTVNYQENPLKDWLHRRCALTILCLILGECALFSRDIVTVPRHGQEVCWVPKYGRNSTDTKRGGGGSIRTMTQKGKVLPEPQRLPPAITCWCSQPGTEQLGWHPGQDWQICHWCPVFFLTHWAHVSEVRDTGEPSAASNIHQHDRFDGDQWWAGLQLLGRNTLTAVRYQDDIPLSDHMLLRWAWVPSRVCQCPGLLHILFSMNYTVYCSQ